MTGSQLPAGMRNNNPGNIKFSPAINWQGQLGPSVNTDQGDPQVVFDSPQSGMRALAMNVLHKYNNGYTTINQLIAGPGGWTPGYAPGAAGVAAASGLPADQPIDMNDPDVLGRVMRGIVTQEQGPSSQQYSDQLIASGIGAAHVKQYDSAGNPITPQATPAPVSGQPSPASPASPALPPPAQVNSVLDEALGPAGTSTTATASSPAATADRAADLPAAAGDAGSSAVNSVLDEALGPATAASAPGAARQTAAASGSAPGAPIATGPGAFAGAGVTPGASGNNPMAIKKSNAAPDQPTGYTPSSLPFLDPISAFANAAVNAVPVVGPTLTSVGNSFDAGVNNLLGYQRETPADRAQIDASTAKQFPAASTAGTVAGTVAPFALAAPESLAGRALGLSGNLLMRTAAGAGSGALISGADTLARGGTAQQAEQNALLGGAIGATAPTVTGLIGKGLGAAKSAFFGPSAPRMLSNALVADQHDPAAVNALLQQRGPGATVADLGANTQGLAGGLASIPGEAQSTVVNNLKARAAQTGNRLAQDVVGTIGQGQPIGALTDQIVSAQKTAAAPLYAAVRSQPIAATRSLMSVLDTPIGQKAYAQAVEFAANDGIAAPATVEALRAAGSIPAGVLDYAKQALDDMTSVAQRTGESNAARQATSKASALVGEMDTQLGGAPGQGPYANARAAFAGPAKVLDAIDTGRQLFSSKTSPEDLQSALAAMSPSEKDGLLAGAQAAVQKAIGTARTDAAGVKSLFDSNYGQQKLALLVGQDQADQIAAALDRERAFSATSGKAYQNSVTSANLAQQRILNPELAGVPKQMAPQSSIGLLISGLEKARSAITGAYRNSQNAHLANMLTGGPLSDADASAVAAAGRSRNALIAPAAISGLAQQSNISPPGLPNWAKPKLVFRGGRWMPQISVGPANAIAQ